MVRYSCQPAAAPATDHAARCPRSAPSRTRPRVGVAWSLIPAIQPFRQFQQPPNGKYWCVWAVVKNTFTEVSVMGYRSWISRDQAGDRQCRDANPQSRCRDQSSEFLHGGDRHHLDLWRASGARAAAPVFDHQAHRICLRRPPTPARTGPRRGGFWYRLRGANKPTQNPLIAAVMRLVA